MRLYYWRGTETGNFGDELNTLLWPGLLPGFFDDDAAQLFLGIGSVLDDRHPAGAVKVVAGAGYGGYRPLPRLDGTWVIHWVRGPLTARRLGLPESRGLGDPASLLDRAAVARMAGDAPTCPDPGRAAFVPHFETARRGAWARAAERAGLALIDPRGDVRDVLRAIAASSLVVSEAMHGAIVADALRVPWVALAPLARVHAAKWADWGAAMDLAVAFRPLAASSLAEFLAVSAPFAGHPARAALARAEPGLRRVASERFLDAAARTLRAAAWATPQLSSDAVLARRRAQMHEGLDTIRRRPLARPAA